MRFILSLLVLLTFVLPARAETTVNEKRDIKHQFAQLFHEKNFGQLNGIAAKYRSGEQRLPSGEWKLTAFYAGVSDLVSPSDDEDHWRAVEKTAREWVEKAPSPAAHIVFAKLMLSHADKIHGDVPDEKVDPNKQWPISVRQSKAHRELINCMASCAVDPEYFVAVIDLAQTERWDLQEASSLFTDAVKTHTYYDPIYFRIAQIYKPGTEDGSYSEFEQFANKAIGMTGEKYGYGIYPKIYDQAFQCTDCTTRTDIFQTTMADWETMRKGIDDIIAQYPDQWNLNRYAFLACQAGDAYEVKKLMSRITTRIDDAWNHDENKYDRCKGWTG